MSGRKATNPSSAGPGRGLSVSGPLPASPFPYSLFQKGIPLKKLLSFAVLALAVAIGTPSSADDDIQCFPAGPVYVWGSGTLPCELGAPVTNCLRCVTSVEVKGPRNQIP